MLDCWFSNTRVKLNRRQIKCLTRTHKKISGLNSTLNLQKAFMLLIIDKISSEEDT